MRRRTKILIKIWGNRLLWGIVAALIIWANVLRLHDNVYSNYEKIIDFGRIKDDDALVKPAIAAIFYAGKKQTNSSLSTYFNHSDNYKKQNVKLIVVPRKVTSYSDEVIKKLYEEIKNNNRLQKVLLVYDKDKKNDVRAHKKMLQQVIDVAEIEEITLQEKNFKSEQKIDEFLTEAKSMVVFLADLDKGLVDEESDFLTAEAVYFAQKHFYQMNVFDIIDTKLAKSLDKDYETLYPLQTIKNEPLLDKQKRNLERFKQHYWHLLSNYLELNLFQLTNGLGDVFPPKTEENYRLYDRGHLVLKAYDEDYVEIFEKAEMQENRGVALLLLDAVKKLVETGKANQARYFKLYVLTDLEFIKQNSDTMLMSYLEQDDGIFVKYEDKSALLVADDRPDNPEDLSSVVRQKAQIPADVDDENLDFYRFKTVEMEYGD